MPVKRDRRAYMKQYNKRRPPDVNAAISRKWRLDHPEQNKKNYRGQHCKRKYGITLEEKDEIVRRQGGVCAICSEPEPGGKGDWHVDHCHITKQIRGVLCHRCNLGLGHFRDDPILLALAMKYILAFQTPN